ncbi:MAG: prepilin peptidase, partial [Chloroflexi bacterium]|nr:prepilin peptidase [Chloroflexota bacterium]
RLPNGESLVTPPSHCPICSTRLKPLDLMPVLSYLWLRGKCRYCGAHIPGRLVVVEVVVGALFLAVYLQFGLSVAAVVIATITSFLLAVAIIDLEHRLILNKMVTPAAVAALALAPFWPSMGITRTFFGNSGMMGSLANSALAGVGAFLFFLIIFLIYPGGMGEGDWKLAGVLGLLVGYPAILVAIWLSTVIAGALAVLLLLLRVRGHKDALPFGPFLAGGAYVVLLALSTLLDWYDEVTEAIAGMLPF